MTRNPVLGIVLTLLALALLAAAATALYYRHEALAARQVADTTTRELDHLNDRLDEARAALRARPASLDLPPRESASGPDDRDARIRELEQLLAARDNMLAAPPPPDSTNQPPDFRRRDRREWLEELKTTDPDRYEEIMQRREESRQAVKEAFARKAAHFLERDKSKMSEDDVAEYEMMLNLLDETWGLAEQARNDDLPRDQRRDVRHQLMENIHTLTPMLDEQRDWELYQVGLDLGYDEQEAHGFVDYMNEVLDITSMRSIFEAMHPTRGFRGPPPGEGPPTP